jgi:hypothetical protein
MNLFLVHQDPNQSARLLAKADPVRARKQLLEGCQLLASADMLFSGRTNMLKAGGLPYNLAHQHHPITKNMVANKHQWELARDVASGLADEFPDHACSTSFHRWCWEPSKLCLRHYGARDKVSLCVCRSGFPVMFTNTRRNYTRILRSYCINYKGMDL